MSPHNAHIIKMCLFFYSKHNTLKNGMKYKIDQINFPPNFLKHAIYQMILKK